jgi:hypothetical protein
VKILEFVSLDVTGSGGKIPTAPFTRLTGILSQRESGHCFRNLGRKFALEPSVWDMP